MKMVTKEWVPFPLEAFMWLTSEEKQQDRERERERVNVTVFMDKN